MTFSTAPAVADRPDPDGRYKGKLVAEVVPDGGPVSFRVSRDGHRIGGWRVTMNVVCASYPVRVELVTQSMPAMKVKPDGRFRKVFKGPVEDVDDVRIEVSGRLRGRRVKNGAVKYEVGFESGTCRRTAEWTARRQKG